MRMYTYIYILHTELTHTHLSISNYILTDITKKKYFLDVHNSNNLTRNQQQKFYFHYSANDFLF